jgi:TonB family protein
MTMDNPHFKSIDDGSAITQGASEAGDIIELLVLSQDEPFLQTLKEAVGNSRRVWPVATAEQVSDLLVAGEVGIFVLDAQALRGNAQQFAAEIKRQFPDLVLIAAGDRTDETHLASLISTGTVYRFIHKPVSPARAKLFAEAAIKRHSELRLRPTARTVTAGAAIRRRWPVLAAAVAALLVGAVLYAVFGTAKRESIVETRPAPAPSLPAPNDAPEPQQIPEDQDRLLSLAENALLEERLDQADAAIAAARKAGISGSRIDFLTAQLAKSKGQRRDATARVKTDSQRQSNEQKLAENLRQATARIEANRLIEPAGDSARDYLLRAIDAAPGDAGVRRQAQIFATKVMQEARAAIVRRDTAAAGRWLEAARGIAAANEISAALAELNASRSRGQSDDKTRLLATAKERLQQDRLLEPASDNAKYYLLQLRGNDSAFPGLVPALQDLGARLVAKARGAQAQQQNTAAQHWLDEARSIGYSSAELSSVARDISATADHDKFLADVIPIQKLQRTRTVEAKYPPDALRRKISGWVELDFTVTTAGKVADVAVHAADPAGTFEQAATDALSQWRFAPVLRNGEAAEQRARVRMRFALE